MACIRQKNHLPLNPRRRSLDPPTPQGRCPAWPARMENLPNPEGILPSPKTSTNSPSRKSLHCNKCSPPSKEHHGTCDKDSHGSSSKHRDKSHSERGSKGKYCSKSPWKCAASLLQMSSSPAWAEKEPHIEVPSLAFGASSQSHQLSETDGQFSFVCPTSTSTPNKTESGLCAQSASSNSRHSMTPFKMGLSGSFSIPSYAGVHCSSITPVTSTARSQQVTSSRWHPPVSFSPLTLQGMDILSAEQATEVDQLTTECQALGSDLASSFKLSMGLKPTTTPQPMRQCSLDV